MISGTLSNLMSIAMINRYSLLPLFLAFFSIQSHANSIFDWTANNVQLLTGSHFKLGDKSRNFITFEHADGWRYGENFLFIEAIERDDTSTEFYGEFYPRLSWSKITGQQPSFSLFNDFSLVAGFNAGNLPRSDPFKAYLLGLGINFNVPKMDFFQLDIQAFKAENVSTTGIQITPVWSMPFEIGSLNFLFRGYLDWKSSRANGGASSVLTQP